MYGNAPVRWHDALEGADRLRVIVNALTRLRFCTSDGDMEFEGNAGVNTAPPGYLPWFDVPDRATRSTPIAFGHWSALVSDHTTPTPPLRSNTLPLDTGCVWGHCLTAARLGSAQGKFELISVRCSKGSEA
jgi:bis(5'-nucleosyl)-tetraphosphatase (symmetrical)